MLKNIVANIIGRFWSILSNYIFIPLYISFLGMENYAVISFSLIIIGIMSVMDAGLSATLSREFAKAGDQDVKKNYKMKVLNTLEVCYWALVVLIILIVFFAAEPITSNWLTLSSLKPEYVKNALRIFGVVVAFQLLGNFYLGGLIGLEKQVKANVYQILWGVFKNGLVLILIFYKPSLIYFFIWQALVTIIYVFALRYDLGRTIDKSYKSFDFDFNILKKVKNFVIGMFLIAIVAAINTQLDKIAISKLLPLNELGYYNLANSLAISLVVLVTPVAVALLPRFTNFYSLGKKDESYDLYKKFILGISIIVFSIGANIIMNAKGLLYVWTGNLEIASAANQYVLFLTLGTSFLAMQVIPFNIAIANGYTRINNLMGICSIFISIPSYWLSVKYFGGMGAAITWCIIQSISTPIYLYFIHKKFLVIKDYTQVLFRRIFLPAIVSFGAAILLSLIEIEMIRLNQFLYISLSTFITLIIVSIFCLKKISTNFIKYFS